MDGLCCVVAERSCSPVCQVSATCALEHHKPLEISFILYGELFDGPENLDLGSSFSREDNNHSCRVVYRQARGAFGTLQDFSVAKIVNQSEWLKLFVISVPP